MAHNFRYSADIDRDHGDARGRGFEHGVGERVRVGGGGDRVGGAEDGGEILLEAEQAGSGGPAAARREGDQVALSRG